MKELNKNGFAISTMLYGLLIIMVLLMSLLMSTMSFSRSNSKKFVNDVIDEIESNRNQDNSPPQITINSAQSFQKNISYSNVVIKITVNDENIISFNADNSYNYVSCYHLEFPNPYPIKAGTVARGMLTDCTSSSKGNMTCNFQLETFSIPNDYVCTGLLVTMKDNVFCDNTNNCNSSIDIPIASVS